jgi:predicted GTPase
MNFQETKSQAKEIILELRGIAEHSVRRVLQKPDGKFLNDLHTIEKQIDNERFAVGVVGVFNTGKSTLLNALLKRELLSTDIIPETAAITHLNYSTEERATVHYWTTEEWKSIELQGEMEDAQKGKKSEITKMVQQIKKSPQFGEFITSEGRSENIPQTELRQYTSANAEKGYAQLVRGVEIGINVDLVQDNIQIVDTPGLNDAIQMRDHITEEKFLPKCDLLLLLLPAKMVFTDYDRRFLERQLEKERIHKLFVIINQIDSLSKASQVKKVVDWARKEIEKTLQDHIDANSAVDLSNKIEIFPVSARESFLNRVPKEERIAQDEEDEEPKWTDERSGVPAFEARLRQFLFEGERALEIQRVIQRRLKTLVNFQFPQITDYLEGLNKPIEKVENDIKQLQVESRTVRQELKNVQVEINKTLYHFETQYDDQVRLVESNIKALAMPIQEKAYKKLDEFLNSHNVISAVRQVEDWANYTLSPELERNIKTEVNEVVSDAQQRVEYLIREVLEQFQSAYQSMETAIKLNLPSATVGDYATLVGTAIGGLAVGLGGNILVGTIIAHLGYHLTGAFLLTNPVGWAIIAALTIPTLFFGSKMVKDKIRSRIREALPGQLSKQINDIAKNISKKFKDAKFAMMNELRKTAEAPAKEIEAQLQQKEDNLNGLLADKQAKEFDAEEKRQAVMQEKAAFENILQRLEALV